MWKRLAVWALLLSLIMIGWQAKQSRDQQLAIRSSFMQVANRPIYDLMLYVTAIEDPQADWNSQIFRINLAEQLDRAAIGAQLTASVMSGLTAGPRWEVASGLNYLGMELPSYHSIARQIANTPGPAAPEKRAELERLAARLKEAGWPAQIGRDDTARWAEFASGLKRLQESDGWISH